MATQAVEIEGHSLPERTRLPMAVRMRIVELFATFHKVSEIQSTIKTEFHIDLPAATVHHYDPHRSKKLSPRLKSYASEVRAAYVEKASEVAVAHRAHRLRMLQGVIEKAEKAKDFGNAIKGLELAAKEMGGVLEGKQIVEHRGSVEHRHLSVEDARAELAMRLGAVIEGGTLQHALPAPDEARGDDAQPIDNAG
jgi:hypothetical protein